MLLARIIAPSDAEIAAAVEQAARLEIAAPIAVVWIAVVGISLVVAWIMGAKKLSGGPRLARGLAWIPVVGYFVVARRAGREYWFWAFAAWPVGYWLSAGIFALLEGSLLDGDFWDIMPNGGLRDFFTLSWGVVVTSAVPFLVVMVLAIRKLARANRANRVADAAV